MQSKVSAYGEAPSVGGAHTFHQFVCLLQFRHRFFAEERMYHIKVFLGPFLNGLHSQCLEDIAESILNIFIFTLNDHGTYGGGGVCSRRPPRGPS
eukprot:gene23893-biopygen9701